MNFRFDAKDEWVFEVRACPFLEILELYVKSYNNKIKPEILQTTKNIIKDDYYFYMKYFLVFNFGVIMFFTIFWPVNNKMNLKIFKEIVSSPFQFFSCIAVFYLDLTVNTCT